MHFITNLLLQQTRQKKKTLILRYDKKEREKTNIDKSILVIQYNQVQPSMTKLQIILFNFLMNLAYRRGTKIHKTKQL